MFPHPIVARDSHNGIVPCADARYSPTQRNFGKTRQSRNGESRVLQAGYELGGGVNRRTFGKQLSTLALGASALQPAIFAAQQGKTDSAPSAVPFQVSVMLWTVYRDLPFEDRLSRMADAGFTNVELTGEFRMWKDEDYDRVNAKRKSLGINFDATSGVRHGPGNPQDRDTMLGEVKDILPIMERLDCPTLILLSGNAIPTLSHDDQHQSCIDGLKAALALVDGKKINRQPVNIDRGEHQSGGEPEVLPDIRGRGLRNHQGGESLTSGIFVRHLSRADCGRQFDRETAEEFALRR
jgi:hypothetical protein